MAKIEVRRAKKENSGETKIIAELVIQSRGHGRYLPPPKRGAGGNGYKPPRHPLAWQAGRQPPTERILPA